VTKGRTEYPRGLPLCRPGRCNRDGEQQARPHEDAWSCAHLIMRMSASVSGHRAIGELGFSLKAGKGFPLFIASCRSDARGRQDLERVAASSPALGQGRHMSVDQTNLASHGSRHRRLLTRPALAVRRKSDRAGRRRRDADARTDRRERQGVMTRHPHQHAAGHDDATVPAARTDRPVRRS
jgi:hypothetical protein